jgi:hypothetical protein
MLLTAIGVAGVVVTVLAYALLSLGKLDADRASYQWINVLGTACILLSLIVQWNLPAFLANAAWIVIGLIGLWRIYRKKPA